MSVNWKTAIEFEDITYKKCDGVARIAFNRPEVRNAFRPQTTSELLKAFHDANEDTSIGVVLLSAEGPSSKDGVYSFCSGGDQKARGDEGYVGKDGYHRLNILEVHGLKLGFGATTIPWDVIATKFLDFLGHSTNKIHPYAHHHE